MKKALTRALFVASALLMLTGFTADTIYRGKPVTVVTVRIVHMTNEEAWNLLDSVSWPRN